MAAKPSPPAAFFARCLMRSPSMALKILLDPGLWFSVGCRRRPAGLVGHLIPPFAAALAAYVDRCCDLHHHRPMDPDRRISGRHDGNCLLDGRQQFKIRHRAGAVVRHRVVAPQPSVGRLFYFDRRERSAADQPAFPARRVARLLRNHHLRAHHRANAPDDRVWTDRNRPRLRGL